MSQTVRGVISRAKGQPVELVDIVIPEPGPGEVVVDIQACGVCREQGRRYFRPSGAVAVRGRQGRRIFRQAYRDLSVWSR